MLTHCVPWATSLSLLCSIIVDGLNIAAIPLHEVRDIHAVPVHLDACMLNCAGGRTSACCRLSTRTRL